MAECCGKIVNDPAHFTYIWTIENTCLRFHEVSPRFTAKALEMTKWHLEINCMYSNYIEVFTVRVGTEDDGPENIEIISEISFLDDTGNPLIKQVKLNSVDLGMCINYPKLPDKTEVFLRRKIEFCQKDALTIRLRMWRTGTEISKHELCFARTRLRYDSHGFVWAIREFSTLQRGQERIFILDTTANNQLTFSLSLTEDEEYICFFIQNPEEEDIIVTLYLLNFEGKAVNSEERKEEDHGVFVFENFFKKSQLMADKESLLPNDVLSVRCEVQAPARTVWSRIESYTFQNSLGPVVNILDKNGIFRYEHYDFTNNHSSFFEAQKLLLEDGILSDVSLQAESKLFPAHKCILSARSPVFKSMFCGDVKEKTSSCVEISGVDEDTMRELLSYVYTDTFEELEWRSMVDLYRAADKYQLLDLKRRCSTLLKSNLSVDGVCVVLSAADLHNDPDLREAAQDFIMDQEAGFFTSETFQNFKKENLQLYAETLERIVIKLKMLCIM